MKTKLSFLAALIFLSAAAMAQKSSPDLPLFTLGAKAGVNITKIDGKAFRDEFKYGYQLGGFAQVKIGERWQVQPEVLFNQYNGRTDSTFSNIFDSKNMQNVTLNYLSIPILLDYSPSKILTFQAGPQFGMLINKNQDLVQNGKQVFKSGDLSLLGGVQLNLMNFRVSGRYFVGLNDISDATNSGKWKNQGFQLSVGMRIL